MCGNGSSGGSSYSEPSPAGEGIPEIQGSSINRGRNLRKWHPRWPPKGQQPGRPRPGEEETNPIEPIEAKAFFVIDMHEILINRSHSIHHAHFQRIMRKFASILTNFVRGAVTHQDLARVEVPEGKRDGLVGLGRFELPTHGLGNRCSIHLSYRPIRERHECSRNRTVTG